MTERDLAMLEFARKWWKYSGEKEAAIRREFGCSATAYYQALNRLIDDPSAEAHDPLLVHRLRRLRAQRQAARRRRSA